MLQHWMDHNGLPPNAIDVVMERAGQRFFQMHETWLANSLQRVRNLSNTGIELQEILYSFPFFLNAHLWYVLAMPYPAPESSDTAASDTAAAGT
jgi:hypothetical protein